MIEIQVNNLVKSFEVGKNVLDGLTFQVDQGERVGLLGRNGAGKTTLFKILTGELDYDEGTVVVGQGRRVGLISQIPVYPDGYTVEDVLRTAVSLGGDSDTLAAITGSIAEAFYGVPENLKQECRKRLTPDLEEILQACENMILQR